MSMLGDEEKRRVGNYSEVQAGQLATSRPDSRG